MSTKKKRFFVFPSTTPPLSKKKEEDSREKMASKQHSPLLSKKIGKKLGHNREEERKIRGESENQEKIGKNKKNRETDLNLVFIRPENKEKEILYSSYWNAISYC